MTTAAGSAWESITEIAQFAVEKVAAPWLAGHGAAGSNPGPRLWITADGGGSNGRRCRLWKVQLQEFADETAGGSRRADPLPGTM